ncbi:uncharacterized protein LOC101461307 [Ceratitis capitata]|uniref:uncharacterized protein LOC101461307 n=1 Tax=Ceratitis capitata TaxID=7213 RepID=UPI0006188B7E|nr:uncharacterized protein LOC101461307 [Ceratitis capitata]
MALPLAHLLLYAAVACSQQRGTTFSNLFTELNHREAFQTIVLENCARNTFISEQVWAETPKLLLDTKLHHQTELKMHFNHHMLVIVCIEAENMAIDALNALANQLQHIRQTRIILWVEHKAAYLAAVRKRQIVTELFRYAQSLQMLNVIALFGDFGDFESNNLVYTFDAFPSFKLKSAPLTTGINYFPDKTCQLYGHPLYTLPDQNQPRTLLYRDTNGKLQLSGYVGKLVQAFSQHLNATLRFSQAVTIGENIYQGDQLNRTRSGEIDFSTSLGSYKFFANTYDFSYPFEFAKWLMMLPLERELEVNEMFLYIFQSQLLRYIIVISVVTFLTRPPTKPRIRSLEDLARSNVRCLINMREIYVFKQIYGEAGWSHYRNAFEVISSWPEFLARRLSLNTSYGYTITTSLWPIIELKQSFSQRKLFRLTTDIVMDDDLVMAIPIQENSVYKTALDRFVSAVQEAGLIHYWREMTFFDMLAVGSIKLDGLNDSRAYRVLVLGDFHWMYWLFSVK